MKYELALWKESVTRCDTASNSFEREEEQVGGRRAGVFPIGGQKPGGRDAGQCKYLFTSLASNLLLKINLLSLWSKNRTQRFKLHLRQQLNTASVPVEEMPTILAFLHCQTSLPYFFHICNFDICHDIQIPKDENKSELSRAIYYSITIIVTIIIITVKMPPCHPCRQ